ncbi:MAG TPA: hypothetical protein VHX16_12650, partial [Chloroflexota bacterium]|nr:hypothetical protein [Chloroflexota bacterium]
MGVYGRNRPLTVAARILVRGAPGGTALSRSWLGCGRWSPMTDDTARILVVDDTPQNIRLLDAVLTP